MKKSEYLKNAHEAFVSGRIDGDVYDAMLMNACIFCHDDEDEALETEKHPIKLKNLKPGEWFTKRLIEYPNAMQVFVRGEYDRTEKKYLCTRFGDASDSYLISGEKEVYTDFIF